MAKKRKPMISCPSKDCSIGRLQDGQRQHLFDPPSMPPNSVISKNDGPFYRCGYCGCVYTLKRGTANNIGYFDNPMSGEGWG
jgi:hypothetical protein